MIPVKGYRPPKAGSYRRPIAAPARRGLLFCSLFCSAGRVSDSGPDDMVVPASVNAIVPPGVAAGGSVPEVLSVADRASKPVTLAVR